MSAKDNLLEDLPHLYPRLTRPELEQVMALLPAISSIELVMIPSIATALEPFVPDIATRVKSYTTACDAEWYLAILRGATMAVLTLWKTPHEEGPDPDVISAMIENIEGDN